MPNTNELFCHLKMSLINPKYLTIEIKIPVKTEY